MITERLINLHMVLKYDSYIVETMGDRYRHLSLGQRICINQERASIMAMEFDSEPYQQADTVNEKIKFIIDKLYRSNIYDVYYQTALCTLKDE